MGRSCLTFSTSGQTLSVLRDGMPRDFSLTARARHRANGRHGRATGIAQAAVQRDQKLTRARVISMFTEPYSLPRAQVQLALRDRYGERGAEETRLHVRRHVVGALARMPIRQSLRHDFVEHHFHVVSHVWIPALVQSQAG